jgi:hypothetical protein
MEQAPVERGNFGSTAGKVFDRGNEMLPNSILKCRGTGDEVDANGKNHQQNE